jgi:hypothetical protein
VHTKRANTTMPLSISDKSIPLGTMVDALWISAMFISSSVRNRTYDNIPFQLEKRLQTNPAMEKTPNFFVDIIV